MIGAMWNGVAGIVNQDRGISIESNNLANSSTVGHKKDEITFADLLYTQEGFGKGVATQSISKQFGQGNIVGTGVGTDIALEGKGFFIVKSRENDGIYYTRAGNFVQAKDGFLVTQDGYKVQGLVPQGKTVSSTNVADTMFTDQFTRNIVSTNINNGSGTVYNINTKVTDYVSSAKSDDISKKGDGYKSSQSKINDIDALRTDYTNKLKEFSMNSQTPEVPSVGQISQIDFSSKLGSLTQTDNKLSINIDGKTYSVTFDLKNSISSSEVEELYNFLDAQGRSRYGLEDPNSIPTQAQIDDLYNAIPDQSVIDAMPTTTAEEIAAKAQAQAQKDAAEQAYVDARDKRVDDLANYAKASSIIDANKELSDKISNIAGFSSSSKDGTIKIESLVLGKDFKISDVKLNDANVSSTNIQEAVKGSGLAMINSAKDALKAAVEKADAKFLDITNTLEYGNLNTIGEQDINVRLDVLGLVDKSVAEVEISNDGFVFVKSGENKFLVGRVSTAAFRNEQGLNPAGGNLFEKTQLSGNAFNADTMNVMREKSLERSNIDYGSTLSHIMIYQKAFEASSKSITTSDEFLKTAIDLIR